MPDPIWQKNLRDAILLDPLTLIHGNVKDVFYTADTKRLPPQLASQPYVTFAEWLALEYERLGYESVILYDPVDGAVALRKAMAARFTQLVKDKAGGIAARKNAATPPPSSGRAGGATLPPLPKSDGAPPASDGADWMQRLEVKQKPLDFLGTLYESVFPRCDASTAVICRFTDRFLSYSDRQDNDERQLSMLIQKAVMSIPTCVTAGEAPCRLALIFDMEGSIPQELHVRAPFAHSILIPDPTLEEREQFFRDNCSVFHQEVNDRFDPARDADHVRLIANLSDGLKTQDLFSLISLSQQERLGLGAGQVKQLLDRFRFGTRENAWLKIKDETLRTAKQVLSRRVKGQDEVINEVVPVLIRAKLGMSDVGGSRHSTKPRGAFFFVGPTGVGKTELSKAIAELIFGDEKAMIRFDMSEYSEEHQQARLVGAPPGYVGFDQGGQLTNAILEKPFSVVLFDEIEKAHGRILDKFLQILDEGRLTDGMGKTVYFSEAILIFTSNIGTAPRGRSLGGGGSVALGFPIQGQTTGAGYGQLAELPYDKLCDHFRAEVKNFFVNELGRPEILNRVGEDNILVFNFLTNEEAKTGIVDLQISSLDKHLRDKHRVGVYCTKAFKRLLMVHPNGFERNGARGVRNLLSKLVLNPLAERLFQDRDVCEGKVFRADYPVACDKIKDQPFDRTILRYEWVDDETR